MKYKEYKIELGEEDQRCYSVRLLIYEMSRYHMRKLDFHSLLDEVVSQEMAKEGKEYLLADNDSYSMFDERVIDEVELTDALVNKSKTILFENEFIPFNDRMVRLLFFEVYDDVTWAPSSFSLPESLSINQISFCANWHITGAIKWLENIDVLSVNSQLKVTDFNIESESTRAIAYENKLYCALVDEDGEMEIGILNNEDDNIPELLSGIEKE
jgi:hypothetical protein